MGSGGATTRTSKPSKNLASTVSVEKLTPAVVVGVVWRWLDKEPETPSGQTNSRSLTKQGGGKEFKPPSNSSVKKRGATGSSAEAPTSESLTHPPVRVTGERQCTLSVCFRLKANKDVNFGLAMGDVKREHADFRSSRMSTRRNFRRRSASLSKFSLYPALILLFIN